MAQNLKAFAYYYPWYAGKEDNKFATNSNFAPYLGLYESSDPVVIHQHCQWAVEYGLSGFLVEWYGAEGEDEEGKANINKNTQKLAKIIRQYPSLQFAIFYDQVIRFGGTSIRYDLPEFRQAAQSDVAYLADTYFSHPQYLRIQNKPLINIYLSRVVHRDFGRMIEDIRYISQQRGFSDLFVVGDEVWWKEVNRNLFYLDAATAYNLNHYATMRDSKANARAYAALCSDLYVRTKELAQPSGVTVIPHIGHAYNDKALRGNLPLRPEYEPDQVPDYKGDIVECMKAMIPVWRNNTLVSETGDAFLFINSWNEWPERSVLEPTLEINTWNEFYDNLRDKTVYLQPHRFEFLKGFKEGKEYIESKVLPTL
jgi:hypothetical protein